MLRRDAARGAEARGSAIVERRDWPEIMTAKHKASGVCAATIGVALCCFAAAFPAAAGVRSIASKAEARKPERTRRTQLNAGARVEKSMARQQERSRPTTLGAASTGKKAAVRRAVVRQAAMRSIPRRDIELARRHREVAVTFDDLPAPADSVVSYTPEALHAMTARLLAELKEYRIPAIGFVNEDKLDRGDFNQRVDILKMWVNAGFSLGNHTYSHVDIDSTPLAAYELDFLRGEEVTDPLLLSHGMRERYFRYPFLDVGETMDTARAFREFLKRQGYAVAPVTIDNQEYMFAAVYAHAMATGDTETADRVAAAFLSYMDGVFGYFEKFSRETLGYEPRQVLLLHADELDTDEMGNLVRMMRARGYRFVSLADALRDPAYRLPDRYDDEIDGGVSWIEHWAHTMGKDIPGGPDPPEYVQAAYNKLQ